MSRHDALMEDLASIGDAAILQRDPYPVVAPSRAAAVADVVNVAVNHGYTIMPLGSGSSFAADFAVARPATVAIMSVRLTGIETVSAFAVKILAGTPISQIFAGVAPPARRTLSGYLCASRGLSEDVYLRHLWPRIRCVDMVTSSGEPVRLSAESLADAQHVPLAAMLIGSRGRLGIVTAIEMLPPLPIQISTEHVEPREDMRENRGLSILEFNELQTLFDRKGAFHW